MRIAYREHRWGWGQYAANSKPSHTVQQSAHCQIAHTLVWGAQYHRAPPVHASGTKANVESMP